MQIKPLYLAMKGDSLTNMSKTNLVSKFRTLRYTKPFISPGVGQATMQRTRLHSGEVSNKNERCGQAERNPLDEDNGEDPVDFGSMKGKIQMCLVHSQIELEGKGQ